MKNVKCVFGIIAIGFCLLFISTRILAADSPQPPWRTTVWPALSSTQWYWYEPQTNLTVEQVDAVFKDVAATKITLLFPQDPNTVCSVKNVQPSIEKPKEKKNDYTVEPWKSKSIRIETYCTNAAVSGPFTFFVPLDAIEGMPLYYISNANNKWLLRISMSPFIRSTVDVVGAYDLYFKDEDSARKFGNAVASILTQNGFSLKLPKLGFGYEDLTPAQAEALGKTRIDNVLVTLVAIDGPADKANIQPLDVITEVNGVKVKNDSHFNSLIEGIASGTKVTLTCLRRTEVVEKDQKQFDWKPIVIKVTAR